MMSTAHVTGLIIKMTQLHLGLDQPDGFTPDNGWWCVGWSIFIKTEEFNPLDADDTKSLFLLWTFLR